MLTQKSMLHYFSNLIKYNWTETQSLARNYTLKDSRLVYFQIFRLDDSDLSNLPNKDSNKPQFDVFKIWFIKKIPFKNPSL